MFESFAGLGLKASGTGLSGLCGDRQNGVLSLLCRSTDEAEGMHPDPLAFGSVPSLCPSLPVQIDLRTEAAKLAADYADHQRPAECAGANERLGRTPDAEPDRQLVLLRARVDALTGQRRRAVASRPVDAGRLTQPQEKVELLGEEGFVVFSLKPEQRKGFGERTKAHDGLRPPRVDQVEGREHLEDAHRVGCAKAR